MLNLTIRQILASKGILLNKRDNEFFGFTTSYIYEHADATILSLTGDHTFEVMFSNFSKTDFRGLMKPVHDALYPVFARAFLEMLHNPEIAELLSAYAKKNSTLEFWDVYEKLLKDLKRCPDNFHLLKKSYELHAVPAFTLPEKLEFTTVPETSSIEHPGLLEQNGRYQCFELVNREPEMWRRSIIEKQAELSYIKYRLLHSRSARDSDRFKELDISKIFAEALALKRRNVSKYNVYGELEEPILNTQAPRHPSVVTIIENSGGSPIYAKLAASIRGNEILQREAEWQEMLRERGVSISSENAYNNCSIS